MRRALLGNKELRPLASLLIILCALFASVFFKITLRQLSYFLYRENKKFVELRDKYYSHLKIYGKMTQNRRLESFAKKRDLDTKKKGQVIQVIDGKALVID